MEQYLDQIPNLADLQRYLEHLALMDPPMPKGELVLEQVSYLAHLRELHGMHNCVLKS